MTDHPRGVLMAAAPRLLFMLLVGMLLAGCHRRGPPMTWIDPSSAPSPVKLEGGECLDLRALPTGWKVSSNSTLNWASFGIPRAVAPNRGLHDDLLLDAGPVGGGREAPREYVEQWVKRPPPQHGRWAHHTAWDVPGFEAYPADDGEIVYVGKGVDALMECEAGSRCVVYDGIARRAVALNVRFSYDARRDAAKNLVFARQVLRILTVRC
jgi:hypothetical protein